MSLLEERLLAGMDRLAHEWHVAAAQNSAFANAEEFFGFHREKAAEAYARTLRLTLPWKSEEQIRSEAERLADAWARMQANARDPVIGRMHEEERRRLVAAAAGPPRRPGADDDDDRPAPARTRRRRRSRG